MLNLARLQHGRCYSSVSYLVAAAAAQKAQAPPLPSSNRAKVKASLGEISRLAFTPINLKDYFRDNSYHQPSAAQATLADSFFYRSAIKHEWTCSNFEEIPDVKVDKLWQERQEKLSNIHPFSRTEYHDSLLRSRTSFGVDATLLKPLPEILFLGHTNAGKSTLINSIFLSKDQAGSAGASTEHAFVSSRAGFTKCLNCYNVGNKLRIVDSPGYGEFGEESQGKVVLDYIERRKQLRRVFLILDSSQGLRDPDAALIEHLIGTGVPFELVLTKVDEVVKNFFPKSQKSLDKDALIFNKTSYDYAKDGNSNLVMYFKRFIDDAGLRSLASLPRIIFNNSKTNKILTRRYGFREIRYAIAECCGLVKTQHNSVTPTETKKKKTTRRPNVTTGLASGHNATRY